jgi:predicted RNase H-like HicB family nuclease
MSNNWNYDLKKGYRIILTPSEGVFIVTSNEPHLQGLVTQGKDEKEAFMMAYEAAEGLLEYRGLDSKNFFLYTQGE